jgi:hypothetical protein
MSYIYKVFEHLKQLRMRIWQHTHTVIITEVGAQWNGLGGVKLQSIIATQCFAFNLSSTYNPTTLVANPNAFIAIVMQVAT